MSVCVYAMCFSFLFCSFVRSFSFVYQLFSFCFNHSSWCKWVQFFSRITKIKKNSVCICRWYIQQWRLSLWKKKFQFLNNVDMSLIYQLLYCSEDYHQKKINVHTLKATWLSLTKKQKKKILKEILNMHTKKNITEYPYRAWIL